MLIWTSLGYNIRQQGLFFSLQFRVSPVFLVVVFGFVLDLLHDRGYRALHMFLRVGSMEGLRVGLADAGFLFFFLAGFFVI